MRDIGATSPSTAQPESLLPEAVRYALPLYVETGVIRQAHPGTYYVSEAKVAEFLRLYVLKAVIFWFLVIIIPVVILEISNWRASTPSAGKGQSPMAPPSSIP